MSQIIFSLLHILSAHAETVPMNLKSVLATARDQSPEVQRAAAVKDEAKWHKVEVFSDYLPAVNASGTYLLDHKYMFTDIDFGGNPVSFPNIVPSSIFDVKAQWGLWDGWATSNRNRAASLQSEAAISELKWAEFKVGREVTLEYYRALASKELLSVAENNLKLLQDHLREVRLFRKSGLSTNYDVLKVEVQVSEAESEILNTQDNLAVAEIKLAEALGQEAPIEPQGLLPELNASIADKKGEDIKGRADLAALAKRSQGFEFEARADGRYWLPRLSAFGTYQYYNNRNDGFDDWDRYRNAYQVGLNLTWNLFDGFADIAKHRQAVAQRVQSEKSLKIEQLKSKVESERWARKFKYFSSVYKARKSDVLKSQESVRLAKQGRKVGARTNTDLLDTENELYRAEAAVVQAQLGAIEALINLELSTGQSLYSFE